MRELELLQKEKSGPQAQATLNVGERDAYPRVQAYWESAHFPTQEIWCRQKAASLEQR